MITHFTTIFAVFAIKKTSTVYLTSFWFSNSIESLDFKTSRPFSKLRSNLEVHFDLFVLLTNFSQEAQSNAESMYWVKRARNCKNKRFRDSLMKCTEAPSNGLRILAGPLNWVQNIRSKLGAAARVELASQSPKLWFDFLTFSDNKMFDNKFESNREFVKVDMITYSVFRRGSHFGGKEILFKL